MGGDGGEPAGEETSEELIMISLSYGMGLLGTR
jgi:hypothetical protein